MSHRQCCCNNVNCVKKHVVLLAIKEVVMPDVFPDETSAADATTHEYRMFVFSCFVRGDQVGSSKEITIWPVRFFASQTTSKFFIPLHDMIPLFGPAHTLDTRSVDLESKYQLSAGDYEYFDMPPDLQFAHDRVWKTQHLAIPTETLVRMVENQFKFLRVLLVELMNESMVYTYCGKTLDKVATVRSAFAQLETPHLRESRKAELEMVLRDILTRNGKSDMYMHGLESLEDLKKRCDHALILYCTGDKLFKPIGDALTSVD